NVRQARARTVGLPGGLPGGVTQRHMRLGAADVEVSEQLGAADERAASAVDDEPHPVGRARTGREHGQQGHGYGKCGDSPHAQCTRSVRVTCLVLPDLSVTVSRTRYVPAVRALWWIVSVRARSTVRRSVCTVRNVVRPLRRTRFWMTTRTREPSESRSV